MVRKSLFIVLSAVVVYPSVWWVGRRMWQMEWFNADYERFYYESVTYTSSWDWELEKR